MRSLVLAAFVLAGGLVILAAYPWSDRAGHPHWSRVGWIPFVPGPVRVRPLDVAGNLLLCAPLGLVAGYGFRRGVLVAGSAALVLSLFVETMQVYSHARFPSTTDVTCNVAGAVLAAALVRRRLAARREAGR